MVRITTALALFLLASPFAHAGTDSLACNFKSEDGATGVASFTLASDGSVTGSLKVNGEAVPAVGGCHGWAHGNPLGMGLQNGQPASGNVRCAFGSGSMRIELYPAFGKAPGLRAIQWDGDELVGALGSSDCK